MKRTTHSPKAKDEDLSAMVSQLAKEGTLIAGESIEIESVSTEVDGSNFNVSIHFRVPHEVVETTDKRTGRISVTSDGARFAFPFASTLSREENLKRFREFYQKRKDAVPVARLKAVGAHGARVMTAAKGLSFHD